MTRALVNSISVMLLKLAVILYSVILVTSCATPKQNASVDADKGAKPKAVSQVTPTGVDAAWQKTVKQNSKKAFIDFVKLNRDTRYTAEVIKRLEKYATARQYYSISAIRAPNEKSRTISRFKITKDYGGGKLDVDGIGEYVLNPATGKFENKFWDSGAEHTILCVLGLQGYIFLSDSKNPLVFQTSKDQGYVYRGGRGLVIEPDGALVALERSSSSASNEDPSVVEISGRKIWSGLPEGIRQYNFNILTKFVSERIWGSKFRVGAQYGRFARFTVADIVENEKNYTYMDRDTSKLCLRLAIPTKGSLGRLGMSEIAGIYNNDSGIVIHVYGNKHQKVIPINPRAQQPKQSEKFSSLLPHFKEQIQGPTRFYRKWINKEGKPIYERYKGKGSKYGDIISIVEYQFVGLRGNIAEFRSPFNEIRVRNPNDFAVEAGVRSETGWRGKNFQIPARGTDSVWVPDGKYKIFFVYASNSNALFKGDDFTLKGKDVEIKIVKVVNGNYSIRQVK